MACKEILDDTITVSSSIFPFDEKSSHEEPLSGSTVQSTTKTRTRERLAFLEKQLANRNQNAKSKENTKEKTVCFKEVEETMSTKEKLSIIESELERRKKKPQTEDGVFFSYSKLENRNKKEETSTRTREKLALLESKLKTLETSSGTGESIQSKDMYVAQGRDKTSTRTRERLAEIERQLAASKMKTSTRTRERLAVAEAELAKLNAATSSKTREKLAELERAIKIEKEKKTSSRTLEVFKKKQDVLRKLIKDNSNLDVAFLVDCTGSMSSYIEETKKDIQEIVSSIKEEFSNKVQVAFVGYRDHSDGDKRIECLHFTEDIDEFKRFVSGIVATGGGDTPEDVLGGIEAAVNLGWSSKNKVLFHVGDAPQHGARFHDMCSSADNYYNIEPRGLQVEDLLNSIKQVKINYFFGKINESTNKMIQEFKNTGGDEIVRYTDMKSPDLMSLLVVDSVTKTISSTIGATLKTFQLKENTGLSAVSEASEGGKTLKDFSISEMGPDEVPMEEPGITYWLECYIPHLEKVSEIKNKIGAINHKWKTAKIRKAVDPFSQGEQRISYHGDRIYEEKYSRNKESIVLKEFKHIGVGRDRREDYIEIMETQAIAAYLAAEFNRIAPKGSKEIQFLHVSVAQVFGNDGIPKYYNVEVLLRDYKEKFKKWNNNCGYVSDTIYSTTLDAFTHWTYDVTEGFLMVVDLQGVDRENQFILTDPSVHCREPRFGLTNLGDVGMKQFFKSHSCGKVCEAMKLKKNNHMRSTTAKRFSKLSTMIWW